MGITTKYNIGDTFWTPFQLTRKSGEVIIVPFNHQITKIIVTRSGILYEGDLGFSYPEKAVFKTKRTATRTPSYERWLKRANTEHNYIK